MLQISGRHGIIIDDTAVNVGLVHSQRLSSTLAHDDFAVGAYLPDIDKGLVFDVPIPSFVRTPLVGVSFRYGTAYAVFCFKSGGSRIARIYLAAHRPTLLRNYPQLANLPRQNAVGFYQALLNHFDFNVLMFDVNPLKKQSGLGLEVYDSQGNVIYDSDLPILQFPLDIHRNADAYRAMILPQCFLPLRILHDYGSPIMSMLSIKDSYPLLFMADRQLGMVSEALSLLERINPAYADANPNIKHMAQILAADKYTRAYLAAY